MDQRIATVPFQPNTWKFWGKVLGKMLLQTFLTVNLCPFSPSFELYTSEPLDNQRLCLPASFLIPDTLRLSPGKWYGVRTMWAIRNHGANRTVGVSSLSFHFPSLGRILYLFMIKKRKYVSMFLNVTFLRERSSIGLTRRFFQVFL